jgi:hypothetical protein
MFENFKYNDFKARFMICEPRKMYCRNTKEMKKFPTKKCAAPVATL